MTANEQIREALKHCLQVLDLAAGEGLHYKAGGETFDAGDAVFDLAKAVGANIANEADIPGVIASLVVDRLTTPADLCGGEVDKPVAFACEADIRGLKYPGQDISLSTEPLPRFGMKMPLYAKPQQPAAEGPIEVIGADIDPPADGPHEQRLRDQRRIEPTLSSRSATPEVGGEELVEAIAQFLHDEGGFDDADTDRTWPEHDGDTGQREGGFVKIVPSDILAKFRDVARRLSTMLPTTPAAIRAETTAQVVERCAVIAEGFADMCAGSDDPCTVSAHNTGIAIADTIREHLTGGGE